MRLAKLSIAVLSSQELTSLSDGLGEFGQDLDGALPVDASIGDGNALLETGGAF